VERDAELIMQRLRRIEKDQQTNVARSSKDYREAIDKGVKDYREVTNYLERLKLLPKQLMSDEGKFITDCP